VKWAAEDHSRNRGCRGVAARGAGSCNAGLHRQSVLSSVTGFVYRHENAASVVGLHTVYRTHISHPTTLLYKNLGPLCTSR